MTKVFPASTGFGVIVTDWKTGAPVSSVTCLVTVVLLPAESVAIIVIVFSAVSVMVVEKAPSAPTSTGSELIVNVTGDDVASFVVPETVIVA